MNKYIVLVAFIGSIIGCNSKEQIPKNIIPPTKMTYVLWDVMKADELANYYRIKDSTWSGIGKHEQLYKTVYQVHHITKEDFRRSMDYYDGHPDLLKPILDSIQKYNDKSMKRNYSDTVGKRAGGA